MNSLMTIIELTDDEVHLVNNALHLFLNAFGHDEADTVHAVRHLLDKFATAGAESAPASQ